MRLDGNDLGWLLTLTVCWLCLAESAPSPQRPETTATETPASEETPLEAVSETGTTDQGSAPSRHPGSGSQTPSPPAESTNAVVAQTPSESTEGHQAGIEQLLKKSIPGWGQDQSSDVWKTPPGVVCRCQGRRTEQCLCLKAGVKCGCSVREGSVWRKTGETVPVQAEPVQNAETPDQGYPVTTRGAWAYWTVQGVQWNNQGTGLKENQIYGLPGSRQFIYRQGRMYDYSPPSSSRAASVPPQQTPDSQRWGWVRYCVGNRCYWRWEPLP